VSNDDSVEDLRFAEAQLGVSFPADYRNFITTSGRVDRDFGGSWLMLYGTEELVPLNRAHDHSDSHPGLVFFGSNGGGEGVGFDFRSVPPPVVLVNWVSAGWQDAIRQADTFTEFIDQRKPTGFGSRV
jgi:SMI1 / KNR4 family (SUKH-1)